MGRARGFRGIAIYLASDASRFHTGDTFVIDGGYTIFDGPLASLRRRRGVIEKREGSLRVLFN